MGALQSFELVDARGNHRCLARKPRAGAEGAARILHPTPGSSSGARSTAHIGTTRCGGSTTPSPRCESRISETEPSTRSIPGAPGNGYSLGRPLFLGARLREHPLASSGMHTLNREPSRRCGGNQMRRIRNLLLRFCTATALTCAMPSAAWWLVLWRDADVPEKQPRYTTQAHEPPRPGVHPELRAAEVKLPDEPIRRTLPLAVIEIGAEPLMLPMGRIAAFAELLTWRPLAGWGICAAGRFTRTGYER